MTEAGPDFVVLTGFLGSGKTTLLRDFLTLPEAADTAVIVNEAGEIGLDGVILRESDAALPIAMLANGCVCCQLGSDLAVTIDALLAAERPAGAGRLRRIVLETSGLSKPGPVLRQLAGLADHRMRASVLATFDATRGVGDAAFEEASAQWAAAHRIVLTKTDTVSPQRLACAETEISSLNPLAEVVAMSDRVAAVRAAFAPLARPAPMAELMRRGLQASHPRIVTSLMRPRGIVAYDDLAAWLDNLAGALGERLLRLKGLVWVEESRAPILVQSVGTVFSPPRPFGGAVSGDECGLIVIARDVAEAEIDAVLPSGLFERSAAVSLSRARRDVPAGIA